MPKYRVVAHRTTEYEVIGDDPEHAKDEMIEGNGKEVGGETTGIEAVRICQTCGEDLLPTTTRDVEIDDDLTIEEPTWCDKCQKEDQIGPEG